MSTTSNSSQNLGAAVKSRAANTRAWGCNAILAGTNFINIASRTPAGRVPDEEEAGSIVLQPDTNNGKARDNLVDAIAGTASSVGRKDVDVYAAPQLAFITSQFRLLDNHLLQILGDDSCAYSSENPPPISLIYNILAGMIHVIKTEHAPTLSTVKRYLEVQNLLKKSTSEDSVYQLVFAAFGLITAFFKPSLAPKANRLQLAEPKSGTGIHRTGTWHSNSEELDETLRENSLCDLLFRFSESDEGPIPRPVSGYTKLPPLVSSNLSYYTLAEFAGLEIEWIDSLCEHLELDSRRKCIKLFRFPSFCMMLCAKSKDHTTWMEKLFSSAMRSAVAAPDDSEDENGLRSAHFFREVIYSYAIFFAQSKFSRSKFNSHQKNGRSKLPDDNQDPLLQKLYSNEWSTALIDELGLGDVKLSYKPETDFPFFAKRLEILQEYSLAQTPNSWKLLWKDRRDLNRFYTLWAALIFGIVTLSMGFIQILLGLAQVIAGFKSTGNTETR